ncbi:MAG: glycosyltransferase WbuB, partial [Planctomycetota bacterium]
SLNKFFDGLSAGKPMLLNYSGWQRKLVEDHQAGRGGQLCNLDDFVNNVLYYYNGRDKLQEYGNNSRNIAEKQFSRDEMAAKALKVTLSAKST